MILAVSGWREWTDDTFVHRQLDQIWGSDLIFGARAVPLQVRVGDARGVDAIVRTFVAGTDGALLTVYAADWEREGKSAGGHRNRRMLLGEDVSDPSPGKPADLLLAFPQPGHTWNGRGSGTWNCVCQAHYRGIEVRIPAYRVADEWRSVEQPLLDLAGQVLS